MSQNHKNGIINLNIICSKNYNTHHQNPIRPSSPYRGVTSIFSAFGVSNTHEHEDRDVNKNEFFHYIILIKKYHKFISKTKKINNFTYSSQNKDSFSICFLYSFDIFLPSGAFVEIPLYH